MLVIHRAPVLSSDIRPLALHFGLRASRVLSEWGTRGAGMVFRVGIWGCMGGGSCGQSIPGLCVDPTQTSDSWWVLGKHQGPRGDLIKERLARARRTRQGGTLEADRGHGRALCQRAVPHAQCIECHGTGWPQIWLARRP
jgi:hypothetical protein